MEKKTIFSCFLLFAFAVNTFDLTATSIIKPRLERKEFNSEKDAFSSSSSLITAADNGKERISNHHIRNNNKFEAFDNDSLVSLVRRNRVRRNPEKIRMEIRLNRILATHKFRKMFHKNKNNPEYDNCLLNVFRNGAENNFQDLETKEIQCKRYLTSKRKK